MPIRSSRGRAGAYRSLWQWPLRSPLRLAVVVVVLLALVGGAVYVGNKLGGSARSGGMLAGGAPPSATGSPSGTGTAAAPTPTALAPLPALTPEQLPVSAAPAEALSTARSWAAAWVNHPDGTTNEQWVAGMRAYTTDEYLGVLSAVDPANVPASRVTGSPRATRVAPRSVQVEVPTDTVRLSVLVVDTDGGWRVSGYDRA